MTDPLLSVQSVQASLASRASRMSSPPISADAVHMPFGASLEPVLRQACGDRLSAISWFRTTWQRGGAATGYATFTNDAGVPQPAVVKVPVPPVELHWLEYLNTNSQVAPRLYALGKTLGSYDLGWVVMERLPHGPLGMAWSGAEFEHSVELLGHFYAATAPHPLAPCPAEKDWKKILEQARRHIADDHDVRHEQRWKNALKTAHKKLHDWLAIWNGRDRQDWVHGDFHMANAMTRQPAPAGPAVLLDYAQVHVGHWVEDAVYFDHLYWARRQRLGGRKLVSMIAHERKKHGLYVDAQWPCLASIKRALLALSTPAMLQADGDPHHVEAALEVLEIEVAQSH